MGDGGRVKRAILALSMLALATTATALAIAPFSAMPPGGALPAGWRVVDVPKASPAEVSLVADNGATVLRIAARSAASSAAARLHAHADGARLAWRWKVDRVVDGGDLGTRAGDDYAARVYVSFDVPLERLPFATRTRIRLARLFFGSELPVAAICYVWDNRHPPGTQAWNAYSDHVRMVVVESGAAHAGEWRDESRDVAADWRAAFGARWPGPVPDIDGVAVSSDTDQTGESVTAWFGDVRLEAP